MGRLLGADRADRKAETDGLSDGALPSVADRDGIPNRQCDATAAAARTWVSVSRLGLERVGSFLAQGGFDPTPFVTSVSNGIHRSSTHGPSLGHFGLPCPMGSEAKLPVDKL